jgi:citrate synthase
VVSISSSETLLILACSDGERGFLLFHGHTLEELSGTDFEDILHLMIWEELPTASQREVLRYSLATAMTKIPPSVPKVIKSFP